MPKTEDLHRDALFIDGHNDTIVAHVRDAKSRLPGRPSPPPSLELGTIGFVSDARRYETLQIGLANMAAGGIDAGFFSIDVTTAKPARLSYALDGIGYFLNTMVASADDVVVATCTDEVLSAKQNGTRAVILAVEHAGVLEGSLNVLRSLYELGVRSIGLTHNVSSEAADGCLEAREGVGLTGFGVALVRRMNELGMVVDLAHISPAGFFHALKVAERPVMFSHGNCDALCRHPRNLTDEQLVALAENGGVIGMSFVPAFVDETAPSLDRLLDHIEHVVKVAGMDTVAIGSDFDGGGTLLHDATECVRITSGLAARGFSEADIRKILGENMLRMIRAATG